MAIKRTIHGRVVLVPKWIAKLPKTKRKFVLEQLLVEKRRASVEFTRKHKERYGKLSERSAKWKPKSHKRKYKHHKVKMFKVRMGGQTFVCRG